MVPSSSSIWVLLPPPPAPSKHTHTSIHIFLVGQFVSLQPLKIGELYIGCLVVGVDCLPCCNYIICTKDPNKLHVMSISEFFAKLMVALGIWGYKCDYVDFLNSKYLSTTKPNLSYANFYLLFIFILKPFIKMGSHFTLQLEHTLTSPNNFTTFNSFENFETLILSTP